MGRYTKDNIFFAVTAPEPPIYMYKPKEKDKVFKPIQGESNESTLFGYTTASGFLQAFSKLFYSSKYAWTTDGSVSGIPGWIEHVEKGDAKLHSGIVQAFYRGPSSGLNANQYKGYHTGSGTFGTQRGAKSVDRWLKDLAFSDVKDPQTGETYRRYSWWFHPDVAPDAENKDNHTMATDPSVQFSWEYSDGNLFEVLNNESFYNFTGKIENVTQSVSSNSVSTLKTVDGDVYLITRDASGNIVSQTNINHLISRVGYKTIQFKQSINGEIMYQSVETERGSTAYAYAFIKLMKQIYNSIKRMEETYLYLWGNMSGANFNMLASRQGTLAGRTVNLVDPNSLAWNENQTISLPTVNLSQIDLARWVPIDLLSGVTEQIAWTFQGAYYGDNYAYLNTGHHMIANVGRAGPGLHTQIKTSVDAILASGVSSSEQNGLTTLLKQFNWEGGDTNSPFAKLWTAGGGFSDYLNGSNYQKWNKITGDLRRAFIKKVIMDEAIYDYNYSMDMKRYEQDLKDFKDAKDEKRMDDAMEESYLMKIFLKHLSETKEAIAKSEAAAINKRKQFLQPKKA